MARIGKIIITSSGFNPEDPSTWPAPGSPLSDDRDAPPPAPDGDGNAGRPLQTEGGLVIPRLHLKSITEDGMKMLAIQGSPGHRWPCSCIACRGEGLPDTFTPEEQAAIDEMYARRAAVTGPTIGARIVKLWDSLDLGRTRLAVRLADLIGGPLKDVFNDFVGTSNAESDAETLLSDHHSDDELPPGRETEGEAWIRLQAAEKANDANRERLRAFDVKLPTPALAAALAEMGASADVAAIREARALVEIIANGPLLTAYERLERARRNVWDEIDAAGGDSASHRVRMAKAQVGKAQKALLRLPTKEPRRD